MPNLQELIELAKLDGGKFFVMDDSGDVQFVLMPYDQYQELVLEREELEEELMDAEKVNQEILRAQLEPENLHVQQGSQTNNHYYAAAQAAPLAEVIVQPEQRRAYQPVDMREEVIDPSFDFEGPKIDIEEL